MWVFKGEVWISAVNPFKGDMVRVDICAECRRSIWDAWRCLIVCQHMMLLLGLSVDLNSVRCYFANAKFKLHDGKEDSGCARIAPLQCQVGIAFWLNSPTHTPLCISRMSVDSGWQNLRPEFSKLVVRTPNSVWRLLLFLHWLVLISEVCLSHWSGCKRSRSRVCAAPI